MGHCAELTTPSLGLRRPWGKQGQPSWSQRLVGGCGQNSACLIYIYVCMYVLVCNVLHVRLVHVMYVHIHVHVFFFGGGGTTCRVRRLVCATSGLRGGSLKNTRASIINCWRLAFLFGLERGGLSELLLLSLIRSHKLYLTSLTSQQHLLLHISIRCVSGCGDLPLADRTPGAPPWRLGQLQVGF